MKLINRLHGYQLVRTAINGSQRPIRCAAKIPAGKRTRIIFYVSLCKRGYRLAITEFLSAIAIEFVQPDAEKLQHLSSVVFVCTRIALRIALLILQHAQVHAHDRT